MPAPNAPSSLVGSLNSNNVTTLQWLDNASDELGFVVERKVGGGAWATYAVLNTPNTVTAQDNDQKLADTAYTYRLYAFNADGNSAYSNEVTVTTLEVPDAPTDFTGAARASGASTFLAWTPPANDTQANYQVARSDDGGETWTVLSTPGSETISVTVTGQTPGERYWWRIRGVNASGEGDWSSAIEVLQVVEPSAPTGLEAEAISASRIRLTWNDVSAQESGTRIERSPDGSTGWVLVGEVGEDIREWLNTGLSAETTYYYRVYAWNASGDSAYSGTASATTLASGEGECANTPYATVADVQARIWSGVLAVSDSSEPPQWQVEDWICQMSEWVDATFAWKYVVPVTDAQDRQRLRPAVAALVAAQVWGVLAPVNPGQEERAQELRAEGLSLLVYHPGGIGTWLKGGSSVVVGKETSAMGRSLLVLPNTTLADSGEAALGQPLSSFTDPEAEGSEPRLFGAGREW